jgi:hypothetical protein
MLAGIVGSNSPRGCGCLYLAGVVCCQVEITASGRSLIQRSHTECSLSNCVWSWSLDNEETGPLGLLRHGQRIITISFTSNLRNTTFLQFGRCIFLWWVKNQQMHHSFNVLVLNILLHVSAFQNAIIRESDMNMLRWCPMSWKAEKDGSCILWQKA